MNNINNKKREIFIISLSLICILITVSVFIYIFTRDADITSEVNLKQHYEIQEIKNNILVMAKDGSTTYTDLPIIFSADQSRSYTFTPNKDFKQKDVYLFIKSIYAHFKVKYGEKIIYEQKPIDINLIKSGGHLIRWIKIPSEYLGKELTLEMLPTIDSNYGLRIPEIYLGTHSDLISIGYKEDAFVFIISIILLVFGVESFFIILILVINNKIDLIQLIIPLFALCSGLYIIISSEAMHLIVGKSTFLYITEYLLFLLIPLLISLFLLSSFKRNQSKLQKTFLYFVVFSTFLNLAIQTIITVSGYSEFMAMQKIAHFVLMCNFFISLLLPFSFKIRKNRTAVYLNLAINLLIMVLIVVYILSARIDFLIFSGFASIIFIFYHVVIIMKNYSNIYKKALKNKMNKKLAFIDSLTKLANRAAFENDIKLIRHSKNRKLLLMIIDINDLKMINDTFGHNIGDEVIEKLGGILKTVEEEDKAKAYRIGGDEFIFMSYDPVEYYTRYIENKLQEDFSSITVEDCDFNFCIAIGYEIATIDDDFNMNNLIRRVDEKMYKDKKRKKVRQSLDI